LLTDRCQNYETKGMQERFLDMDYGMVKAHTVVPRSLSHTLNTR